MLFMVILTLIQKLLSTLLGLFFALNGVVTPFRVAGDLLLHQGHWVSDEHAKI